MNPLFIENGRLISGDEFRAEVDHLARSLRASVKGRKLAFAIEAENRVAIYAKVISLLGEGHVVLPCSPYQFRDPAYRTYLRNETATDFAFVALDQPPAEAVASTSSDLAMHPRLASELDRGAQPLVLRTSGTSKAAGKKFKYVLHDYRRISAKHAASEPYFTRALAFFPFESVAGIEGLTEVLRHRRTLVVAGDSLAPKEVGRLIRENSVDYLLTTPSFLNLMMISRLFTPDMLGPLRKLKFGSEPAARVSVSAIARALPGLELMHVYGMTEIGILRSKTCAFDPTLIALEEPWRLGGERLNLLEVKSPMTAVGYLNAELPCEEGWFKTGDAVEPTTDGPCAGYLRILGRDDETINVAGKKFLPSELEELLLALDNVAEAAVTSEKNDLIGHAIVAKIFLARPEDEGAFRARLKVYCGERVPAFMIPHRVVLLTSPPLSPRSKKIRRE